MMVSNDNSEQNNKLAHATENQLNEQANSKKGTCFNWYYIFYSKYSRIQISSGQAYPEPSQISKMKLFLQK